MTRLHLSAAATFVAENIGRTLLEISVSMDDGSPVRGLPASAFTVTDLLITNERILGSAALRVETLREEGPSFYSMLLANDAALTSADRAAFVGTHIVSISVVKHSLIADQLNEPPRIVAEAQGFTVTTYTVL